MSLRFLLHVLFLRKWYILLGLFGAPLAAGIFLLFAEPIFVSKCKLEVHDRNDERDPLHERRPTQKDDTFVQTQIELIFTDRVLGKVVDRVKLVPAPPSQSLITRWTGFRFTEAVVAPEVQRIDAVRELRKRITAEAINPMVLSLGSQMNTPALAQQVTETLYNTFIEEFSEIQRGTEDLARIFKEQEENTQLKIDEADAALQEFYKSNVHNIPAASAILVPPQVPDSGPLPATATAPKLSTDRNSRPEAFTPNAEQLSPLTKLRQDVINQELELIKIKANYNAESYQYKRVSEQLEALRHLLNEEERKLADQIKAADQERSLIWQRDTYRNAWVGIHSDRLKAEQNLKIKGQVKSTVIVQDPATFDPRPIFPKKSLILIAAAFVGLVLGMGLAYIAHSLDATYRLPEDFTADTGIPVLAALPIAGAA